MISNTVVVSTVQFIGLSGKAETGLTQLCEDVGLKHIVDDCAFIVKATARCSLWQGLHTLTVVPTLTQWGLKQLSAFNLSNNH